MTPGDWMILTVAVIVGAGLVGLILDGRKRKLN